MRRSIAWAACLLALALAAPAAAAPPPPLAPRPVPAVPTYGDERAADLTGAEARAAAAIRAAFGRAGAKAPAFDAALSRAAAELARRALDHGLEAAARPEAVRLARTRAGAAVPSPTAQVVAASGEEAALGRLEERASGVARSADPPDFAGIGIARGGGKVAAVLLLGARAATLAPFPAQVAVGSTHRLEGRLLPPLSGAEVHVTPPGGRPVRLPGSQPGAAFRVPVAFDRAGRWAVEVLGHGPRGPEVALLLDVWAGTPIPAAPAAEPAAGPEPATREAREALVAREVNELRRSRGLKPLAIDPALARAARAYAEELAATGRFAHRSERSGDPADRVRRAGYRFRRVAENLAEAPTARAAHRATVESPGHLANLLDPAFTEAGYGIAVRKSPAGGETLILVELFGRPAD